MSEHTFEHLNRTMFLFIRICYALGLGVLNYVFCAAAFGLILTAANTLTQFIAYAVAAAAGVCIGLSVLFIRYFEVLDRVLLSRPYTGKARIQREVLVDKDTGNFYWAGNGEVFVPVGPGEDSLDKQLEALTGPDSFSRFRTMVPLVGGLSGLLLDAWRLEGTRKRQFWVKVQFRKKKHV